MNQIQATVFVVDDDESLRSALKRLLKFMGFQVAFYDSAQAFLEQGPRDQKGCMILDVRMPGMSGMELQEQLAQEGCRMPIIFMTGHETIPMSVKAVKAGAVDFIEKPFDEQTLIDAVHTALKEDEKLRREHAAIIRIQQHLDLLTPREYDVFSLVVTGKMNKQIAGDLGMSEKTVKVHRARVMRKMKAPSLADLVRMSEKLRNHPDPVPGKFT